jgi:hypothetical protein
MGKVDGRVGSEVGEIASRKQTNNRDRVRCASDVVTWLDSQSGTDFGVSLWVAKQSSDDRLEGKYRGRLKSVEQDRDSCTIVCRR